MTENDLEIYHQKGGTYTIPVEVMNDVFEELKKKTSRCTERNHKIRCRDRKIERRDKKISKLEQRIDKTTNYYLHKLNEQGSMPDEAVKMFNILEGNVK